MRVLSRPLASVTSLALAAGLLVVVPPTATAADPEIALAKSAPKTVLAGQTVPYSLTVTNVAGDGTANLYNASVSDTLPAGTTYVAGSAAPFPDPQVITNAGQQTLVWTNLEDIADGGSLTVAFEVKGGTDVVGATLTNSAVAVGSTDPRQVPDFDASGSPIQGPTDKVSNDASATTSVTAIKVDKAEPSPEAELLRGVHKQTTVYTLTVTNNLVAPTNAVQVVDYIPAGLEFLGCGTVDNSAPGTEEYPGSGRLPTGAAPADCVDPDSVETVQDPAGRPAGVYTKVTWSIGNLAAGAVRDLTYVAGIPLRANAPFPAPAPTPGSLLQAANLDNNTGASTREPAGAEGRLTNAVEATGTYTGPHTGGVGNLPVSDDTTHTVTIEDVRLLKSVSPDTFTAGAVATFTLQVDVSEYVSASNIVVTDALPDGYCPLGGNQNYSLDGAAECAPGGGSAPTGASYQSVVANTDGSFDITFSTLPTIAANGSATITFQARMRSTYSKGGAPTSSADEFVNTTALTANTTAILGTDPLPGTTIPNGPITGVTDSSSATQGTAQPTIDNTMNPRQDSPDCTTDLGAYTEPPIPPTGPDWTFRTGDTMCFKLRVEFPNTISTRNPIVTDFLPAGTALSSDTDWATTGANTVANVALASGAATSTLVWTMGTPVGGASFADPDDVFEVTLAVTVTAPAPPPDPDLLGNLMKLQWEKIDGRKEALRDQVGFALAAPPPVDVRKGVYQVNTPASGPNPPNTDGATVQQGSTVTYRVDVDNTGTPPDDPNARAVQVWDVLPVGVSCAAVSISNYRWVPARASATDMTGLAALPGTIAVTCTDPTASNEVDPRFGDTTTQSVIRWTAQDSVSIPAGETLTLLYDLQLPSVLSVSARLDNTAAVRSFQSETNVGDLATFFPADNVDAAVPAADENAAAADDPSHVVTPPAVVAKTGTTSITETNNNTPTQATIGERVTYTYSVVVPARTSAFNGSLTDALPPGYVLQPTPTLAFFPDAASTTTGTVPAGVTLDPATGAVSFGATYTNATATDQRFEVTATALVTTAAATPTQNNLRRTNTATFSSQRADGSNLPPVTATYDTRVVQPQPSLAKSASPTTVEGGATVTYTLTAGNTAGRPPLHDTVVVDCLPLALTYASATPPAGTTVATALGDGSNGCTADFTRILWTIGTLAPGQNLALTYTATMKADPPAGESYTNSATVSGSSIAGADPNERTYSAPAQATVRVSGVALVKTVSPERAPVGETVTYRLSVAIPPNVIGYDAAIIDRLPAGITATTPPLTTLSTTCEYLGTTEPCTNPLPPFTPLTPSGQKVAWLIGDVSADARIREITITYSTTVADIPSNTAGVPVTNTAQARWNLTDGAVLTDADSASRLVFGSNQPTATVTVLEPSMRVTKAVSKANPTVEDTFTYTVTATNGSGANVSPAHSVTVVDTVPVGVVVQAGTVSNGGTLTGSGANGGGTITWTLPGPIAPGGSVALTYSAELADSSTLTTAALTNTVDITRYSSQPNGQGRVYDNVTPATAAVTPAFPRFTPTKSAAGGTTALIGEPFAWQLQVENTGTAPGYDVDVTDVLPVNWAYDAGSARVSVAGAPATAVEPSVSGDQRTLMWTNLGDLAVGQSLIITLTATPQPAVTTTPGVGSSIPHTNTVSTLGRDGDGNTGNASGGYAQPPATANASINAADLAVTKTPDGGSITAGVPFDWRVVVRNNGPDASVAPITVTDTLPAGLAFVSATGAGWSCPAPVGDTLTCTRATNLASGATSTIIVRMRPPADAPSGTRFDNTATVKGTTLDPVPGNNTDTGWVSTTTSADLRIVKERAATPVVAGRDLVWTLAVDNLGPSVSRTPITVTDTLPAGLAYVSATGTDWTCAEAAGTVTCTYGEDLAVNELAPAITLTTRLAADVPPGTVITNTGVVTGTTPDANPGNNTDDATVTVTALADLYILKSHQGGDTWNAGEQVTFDLEVGNKGPSDAVDVVVEDTFDARLVPDAASVVAPAGWTCDVTSQVLRCTVDRLDAGATADLAVTVTIASDVPSGSQIPNRATVASSTPDPILSNNTDADNIDTRVLVDLAIVKTHDTSADPRIAGTEVTFDLAVRNDGPSDEVAPITVTDAVPAGMTYVDSAGSAPAWACALAADVVTCTLNQGLPAGDSAPTLALTFLIDPAVSEVPTTLANTAEVSGTSDDGNSSNNASTDEVPVENLTNLVVAKRTLPPNPVQAGTEATFEVTAGPRHVHDHGRGPGVGLGARRHDADQHHRGRDPDHRDQHRGQLGELHGRRGRRGRPGPDEVPRRGRGRR